jgi:hypothetical protein
MSVAEALVYSESNVYPHSLAACSARGDLFCSWHGMLLVLIFFFERPAHACFFWRCGPGAGWGVVDQQNQPRHVVHTL